MNEPIQRTTSGGSKKTLLEVGTRCFARKGYRATSVREICSKAGANVSALSYHFGGKFEFYTATLIYAFDRQSPVARPTLADAPHDPQGQLGKFIRWFLECLLLSQGTHTLGDLVQHELLDPTDALDVLVDLSMKPACQTLSEIVAAVARGRLSADALRFCTIGILGQCLVYRQCRPMLERIYGSEHFTPARIEGIARHVLRYALAGIRAKAEVG